MSRTNLLLLSFIEKAYNEDPKKGVTLKDYSKGTLLCKQDEQPYKIAIVRNGFAKCFYSEDNGKDFILEFLGKGEIIGEIEALRNIKCLCNVEAVTDVQVYVFSTSYFKSLLDNNHQFSRILLEELAERIINTSCRAAHQQLYTIKYGLSKLLDLQDKQGIKLSKTDMASYLGIEIRSLNRFLKELDH
ncbi:Crp/Fnr family transcriptional regulator [Bacteroides sp.]|uniref:Crp/Fnr family transcriptional regulator n=1 Tax=Bacteroides sp. TaxID=29523 RepID=UPI002638E865|nr:Crp/Fnr family transcriptional regulator [Bacteroides sp.]